MTERPITYRTAAPAAPELIHHVSRYGNVISCGATGPVRCEEFAKDVTCEACHAADDQHRMDVAHEQALEEHEDRKYGRTHRGSLLGGAIACDADQHGMATASSPRIAETTCPDCVRVVESAHDEALRDDAYRTELRAELGTRDVSLCTAPSGWYEPHLFESGEIELNPEGYDEFERCSKPADDRLHIEGAHAEALRANDARRRAGYRAAAADGFRRSVRAIRTARSYGLCGPETYRDYRKAMQIYASTVRAYDRMIGGAN